MCSLLLNCVTSVSIHFVSNFFTMFFSVFVFVSCFFSFVSVVLVFLKNTLKKTLIFTFFNRKKHVHRSRQSRHFCTYPFRLKLLHNVASCRRHCLMFFWFRICCCCSFKNRDRKHWFLLFVWAKIHVLIKNQSRHFCSYIYSMIRWDYVHAWLGHDLLIL